MTQQMTNARNGRWRSAPAFLAAVTVAWFVSATLAAPPAPRNAEGVDDFEITYTATFSPDDLIFEQLMGYDVVRFFERLPDTYTGELCDQKRDDVYRHVYTNYSGAGQSIYVAA